MHIAEIHIPTRYVLRVPTNELRGYKFCRKQCEVLFKPLERILLCLLILLCPRHLLAVRNYRTDFDGKTSSNLLGVSVMFIKKCQAISILLSLGILNIGPNTPWLFWAFIQKLLQNFDGTTSLPVNGGLKNFSIEFGISKQWTQNTVPSSIFRGCLPNVIKRWKSSTESVRPFVANKYHNCSMANRQWICR